MSENRFSKRSGSSRQRRRLRRPARRRRLRRLLRLAARLTGPSLSPQERLILDRGRRVGLIRANRLVGYWRWGWCLLLSIPLAFPSFGLSLLLLPLIWLLQHRHTRFRIEQWALDLREI